MILPQNAMFQTTTKPTMPQFIYFLANYLLYRAINLGSFLQEKIFLIGVMFITIPTAHRQEVFL